MIYTNIQNHESGSKFSPCNILKSPIPVVYEVGISISGNYLLNQKLRVCGKLFKNRSGLGGNPFFINPKSILTFAAWQTTTKFSKK